MSDLTDFFGEPIAVYSMADALADGTLVGAGDLAKELFTCKVVLSAATWADCVAWADEDTDLTGAVGQSETGRLWDVLWMTFCAVRRAGPGNPRVPVELARIPREATDLAESAPEEVHLVAHLGLDDEGGPALTICLPEED